MTINLTPVFTLIDEVVSNTDSLLGLVVLGVSLTIAMGIGGFITGMLNKILKK